VRDACSGKFAQSERAFRAAVVVFTANSRPVQLWLVARRATRLLRFVLLGRWISCRQRHRHSYAV